MAAQGVNFVDCSRQKLVLARVFDDLETSEKVALCVAKRKKGGTFFILCAAVELCKGQPTVFVFCKVVLVSAFF